MNTKKSTWEKKRFYYIFTSIIIAFIGFYLFHYGQGDEIGINNSDLSTIANIVISKKPILTKTPSRNSIEWIELYFEGYEKKFEIGKWNLSCSNQNEILNNLKVGDTVSIKVLTKEIDNLDNESLLFKSNEIYSLFHNGTDLLDLNCSNEAAKKDNNWMYIIFFILAPIILIMGLMKKEPGNLYLFKVDP